MAPWAHNIMETKSIFSFHSAGYDHIIYYSAGQKLVNSKLRRLAMWLAGAAAGIGLLIGAMGFIIFAASRWEALVNFID